jgi:hypothetical protein
MEKSFWTSHSGCGVLRLGGLVCPVGLGQSVSFPQTRAHLSYVMLPLAM